MLRKKVLVACMLDSIHAARWLTQFTDQKIDFLLFPSSPHRRGHPELERLLAGSKIALSLAAKHLNIKTPKFEVANTTHYC